MTYQDELAAALTTFVVEARELLQDMETGLLGLETETDPGETVNAVFRAAHTIKGSSGLFGLDHVVRFTHVMESVLDRLRAGEICVSGELVGALLPCRDHVAELVDAVGRGDLTASPAQERVGEALLAELAPFLVDVVDVVDADGVQPAAGGDLPAAAGAPAAAPMHLSLRFGPDCLRSGMDPLSFVRYLSTIGEIAYLVTVPDLLPDPAMMDAETCYLDFELGLVTTEPVASVLSVFDFVRDESIIRVLPAGSPLADYVDLAQSFGGLSSQLAELLVAVGAVGPELYPALGLEPVGESLEPLEPLEPGPPAAAAAPSAAPQAEPAEPAEPTAPTAPVPAPVLERRVADRRAADGPGARGGDAVPAQRRDKRSGEGRSIRVDAPRLDRLVDVVGELVIAGASASLRAGTNGDETMAVAMSELMRLVEEVRDSALQLRMVPIGSTFSRFQRVVRDVSADLGKDVHLVITGGESEVDKALVERIGDPLMHLVRNSLDHGIEPPEVRAERGKPARGTLHLNAFHDSGSIVIEVQDDGGGIDVDRVLATAVKRGLVEPGTNLSDKEIFGLIFEPGFSTAEQVSDLSGRGVGMDVVKRNVAALRGTIDVESRRGVGSTFRIRLPLTLAIIDGFLVGVGGASYVVPLDRVVECVELPADSAGRGVMDLRGEVLPFIRLRQLFALDGERPRRENVVVVEYAGQKTGLVVDALLGEFQTVIKPLGELFGHVRGIGGSTILGSGDVALIIDVPVLMRQFTERGQPVGAGV